MATNKNSVEHVVGGNRPESMFNLRPTLKALSFCSSLMQPTPYLQPIFLLDELLHAICVASASVLKAVILHVLD